MLEEHNSLCHAEQNSNVDEKWSKINLGHEGNAEWKSGADQKGLIEFQLARQAHLHNVREQVNWPKFRSNPVMEQVRQSTLCC